MKTIGLIGGMSWESSAEYYRLINVETKRRLGGSHNARSLMLTVDFDAVELLQHRGEWDELGRMLADAARQLEHGGADFLVLCTNTMHKLAGCVTGAVRIPLLHIADVVGEAIRRGGERRIGLLGTRFTMEQDFYAGRLRDRFGIETIVPAAADRQAIHDVIYHELCQGRIVDSSRAVYQRIVEQLAAQGAEAVVLGCTEIGLLLRQSDCGVPLFDSTLLHAHAAVELALQG
jgi:aspartate racemase